MRKRTAPRETSGDTKLPWWSGPRCASESSAETKTSGWKHFEICEYPRMPHILRRPISAEEREDYLLWSALLQQRRCNAIAEYPAETKAQAFLPSQLPHRPPLRRRWQERKAQPRNSALGTSSSCRHPTAAGKPGVSRKRRQLGHSVVGGHGDRRASYK